MSSVRGRSALDRVPKTEPIAVAVLDVEVAAAVGFVANVPRDLHALRFELPVQRIGIVHPNVAVPRPALGVDQSVGSHHARLLELRQHDDDAIALYHAERRRVMPEAVVAKPEPITATVSRDDNIF